MILIDPKNLSPEINIKYSVLNNAFKLDKIKNAELDLYTNQPKDELNLIIGDDKVPDTFIPQLKLQRWSNEVNFSVRLIDDETGQETVNTLSDKIVWEKGNKKIEFYDFAEGEGGYKLVWFLKKKPKTNKVEFTFQSKNLFFYYQPPLTQEFQNGYSEEFKKEIIVTETDVKDLDGNILIHRPLEIVGSYVFYHQTKGGMVDKFGKAYGTGQAGIIYRPHVFDSNGAETWGILKIENGIYSVEIPQEFLDSAVYPIKSNDTFGYTTAGGSTYDGYSYAAAGSMFTSPSNISTVTDISIYGQGESGYTPSVKAIIVLHSSLAIITNGKGPGVTLGASDLWKTQTFATPPTVSINTEYVLMFLDNNNNNHIHYNTGDANQGHIDTTNNYTTPTNPTDATHGTQKFSIYATYTPSGGGSIPNKIKQINQAVNRAATY